MKYDVRIKNGIIIPEHELHITTSRAGGPGGQHVNKTSTRVTVRWNVLATQALTDIQKKRVLEKLGQLSQEGDLLVHNASTRSQAQNKKLAFAQLAKKVRAALHVPKKRMKRQVPKSVKERRLQAKKRQSALKKLRRKKKFDE